MGPLKELILELASRHKIAHFVETGTYKANTTVWAAEHFENVSSIEWSKDLHDAALERCSSLKNVKLLQGSSPDALPEVLESLNEPALIWLDAHTCACQLADGSSSAVGEVEDICPTLEEIEIINNSRPDHFLLIDDASLFLMPPHPPHIPEKWPDLAAIMRALDRVPGRYVAVVQDVIVAVPAEAKATLQEYCTRVTEPWQSPNITPPPAPRINIPEGLSRAARHPLAALRGATKGFLRPQ